MSYRAVRETPSLPWYPEWTRDAECAKYSLDFIDEVFFDYGRNAHKIGQAKAICAMCPVIRKCYQQNREVPIGIFYGMTAVERWRQRGLKGYPTTNDAYSYFGQYFGKSFNGIGPRAARESSS